MMANGDTGIRFITPAQRRKIFAVRRELGLTDAAFYFAMHTLLGKTSVRSLTVHEAAAFIDELLVRPPSGSGRQWKSGQQKPGAGQDSPIPQRPAAQERPRGIPPKPPGTLIQLATDEQLAAIDALLQELNLDWGASEFSAIVREAGVRRGIRTADEASRVEAALKRIAKKEGSEAGQESGGRH